jgi:hypothetical protein
VISRSERLEQLADDARKVLTDNPVVDSKAICDELDRYCMIEWNLAKTWERITLITIGNIKGRIWKKGF